MSNLNTLASFPNGFNGGVAIRGMPVLNVYGKNVWWVDASGARIGDGTFRRPLASLETAINKADTNDIIMVKSGHTETISTATAINLDKAGITIIGLGIGASRPTFTLDTATTTTIPVTANNITVQNCIFTANFADIVAFFTLTTAKHFALVGNYFKATATNMNALYVVDTNATTADCDGLTLIGNKWIEPDAATVSMVKMDGTNDDVTIERNYVNLGVNNNKAALMAIITGKIVTNLMMRRNEVYRLNTDTATGAILVSTDGSTNTGMITENYAQHADTAAELLVTATAGFGVFQNFNSGVAGASGYILPAVDS